MNVRVLRSVSCYISRHLVLYSDGLYINAVKQNISKTFCKVLGVRKKPKNKINKSIVTQTIISQSSVGCLCDMSDVSPVLV